MEIVLTPAHHLTTHWTGARIEMIFIIALPFNAQCYLPRQVDSGVSPFLPLYKESTKEA